MVPITKQVADGVNGTLGLTRFVVIGNLNLAHLPVFTVSSRGDDQTFSFLVLAAAACGPGKPSDRWGRGCGRLCPILLQHAAGRDYAQCRQFGALATTVHSTSVLVDQLTGLAMSSRPRSWSLPRRAVLWTRIDARVSGLPAGRPAVWRCMGLRSAAIQCRPTSGSNSSPWSTRGPSATSCETGPWLSQFALAKAVKDRN